MTNQSGAGIILIENYRNHSKTRQEPAVILFRDVQTGKFTDLGGRQDNNEPLNVTASREAKEESCNLFKFDPNFLAGMPSYKHFNYVCYFMGLQGPIESSWYNHNRDLLSTRNVPREFKETDQMVRFYISDLRQIINQQGDLTGVTDANGNTGLVIEGRTKACIREYLIKGNQLPPFVKLNQNTNFARGPQQFLYGTKCYYL